MQLFQDLFDRSKQYHQAPFQSPLLHAQQGRYKIIHLAIKIPNLPAPLHYLNFYSMIGQPRAAIFQHPHLHIRQPLDVATVLVSSSVHSVGHFHAYDIAAECHLNAQNFAFAQREKVLGNTQNFELLREDDELCIRLQIQGLDLISYFYQLRWSLGQYWSIPCQCHGEVKYQGKTYPIQQLGVLEYARNINFAYLPLAFYTYQLIPLSETQQLIVLQLRDPLNSVIYSRLYLKNVVNKQLEIYDQGLYFKVTKLYPVVKTPNDQMMYLPRVFDWHLKNENLDVVIQGQSRGDFKFGLGAGFVGSFSYSAYINGQVYTGEHAYIEYIDCRNLKYQESEHEKQQACLSSEAIAVWRKLNN